MIVAGAAPAVAEWNAPEGIAPRGTVTVIPGRGEHPGVYERFGRAAAATVVLFLERLRPGVDAPALARSDDLR